MLLLIERKYQMLFTLNSISDPLSSSKLLFIPRLILLLSIKLNDGQIGAHVSQQLQYFTLCLGIMHPTKIFQCQPVPPVDTEPITVAKYVFFSLSILA